MFKEKAMMATPKKDDVIVNMVDAPLSSLRDSNVSPD
jgi:hypothetical protein